MAMMASRSDVRRDTRQDGSRYYYVPNPDGTEARLPSVTTILQAVNKPALAPWMAREERDVCIATSFALYRELDGCKPVSHAAWDNSLRSMLGKEKAGHRKARKAAEIGSEVHALAEWTIKKELGLATDAAPRLSTRAAENAFAAWLEWRDSVHLEPVAVEQTVWSREHGYAGTLDLLARVNGTLAVLDYKTGQRVYPEARLQGVAYARAVEEMGHAQGEELDAWVIRLPKIAAHGFEAVRVPADEHAALFSVFLSVLHVWQWLEDEREAREAPAVAKAEAERDAETHAQMLLTALAQAKSRGEAREVLERHARVLDMLQAEAPERAREVEAFALAWEG